MHQPIYAPGAASLSAPHSSTPVLSVSHIHRFVDSICKTMSHTLEALRSPKFSHLSAWTPLLRAILVPYNLP